MSRSAKDAVHVVLKAALHTRKLREPDVFYYAIAAFPVPGTSEWLAYRYPT